MVASDEVAVIPSDVVWKLTGKKLKLMTDNRTHNVTAFDTSVSARRAS